MISIRRQARAFWGLAALAGFGLLAVPAPARAGSGDIERAWRGPAPSLEQRVAQTRRAAMEVGVWNNDAAAWAVLGAGFSDDPLARARAAVSLAPDLPAARMALAQALWLHGDAPMSALRVAASSFVAFVRHLEGSLWFGGSTLYLLAMALMVGGLAAVAIAGVLSLREAAHDFGDPLARKLPAFARAALLAALLLVPLVLGEGAMGLALGLLAVGVVYGSAGQRVALALAVGAVVAGAYPVARLAGSTLSAFSADPVAAAAATAATGFASAADVARLEAVAGEDPLAARALARLARRAGNLGEADARYTALLDAWPDDPVLANNAANVRLGLGHMASALDLYRRSANLQDSPVALFNLSQAQGRAFQVDELAKTLEAAQRLDGPLVSDLTQLQGAELDGFVVDLPLPRELIWRRAIHSPGGEPIARELRREVAPGRLGDDVRLAGGAFLAVYAAALTLGSLVARSRRCRRCGSRICPRCDPPAEGAICDGCGRLFQHGETSDRELRQRRLESLQRRERRVKRWSVITALVVPGTAGFLARRPLRGVVGAIFAVVVGAALVWRNGVVPDPFVAGPAGPAAFVTIASVAALGYAVVVAMSVANLKRS